MAHLAVELSECGRRGSATPRRVLAAVSAGIRSAAELEARKLSRRTGLPDPWRNVEIRGGGRRLGVADAWFDEVALAWEINSFAWHLDPADYAREQERTARFVAAGVPVLPTQPHRLRTDAKEVIRELCAAYAHAKGRPRPDVQVIRRP